MRARLPVLLALSLLSCDKSTIHQAPADAPEPDPPGLEGASSDDMDPNHAADDMNLEDVAALGKNLAWMEHVLMVGMEKGLPRVGKSTGAAAMPIASVDPGFHSGQVTVYRWLDADLDDEGKIQPEKARKWLVIPLLLKPDRVLELEQFSDEVGENSDERHIIAAIDLAQQAAVKEFPGGQWSFHPVRGKAMLGVVQRGVTRVYLFGRDSPDYEVLVTDRFSKRKTAEVVSIKKHHDPGHLAQNPPLIEMPRPSPLTVARVLPHVPTAGKVEVAGSDGSRWTIDDQGAIEAIGAKPADEDDPEEAQ